jgi:UDP-glucuronate 4-epimerase
MTILVTGAAGFIGMHVAQALLARGERVLGVDDLNDYYDVALKEARVAQLTLNPHFTFAKLDISDHAAVAAWARQHKELDRVVHLAAQAGVRYSLSNPFAYARANLSGHLSILELCRNLDRCKHLVYASSSSVYGGNSKLPFCVGDPVDEPKSLYAATKRADELMSACYADLFRYPATGLRFFTVYGPWGRPDMAAYLFAEAIMADRPIRVFNHGDLQRDFTYIDDIVAGVLGCLDHPPSAAAGAPHRIYNLGNSHGEPLMRFIAVLEAALGRRARLEFAPMQPGDVKETFADIGPASQDFGFSPKTRIEEGLPRFVAWFLAYHGYQRPTGSHV